jgi:outer membrane protein assembly factor BamB
MKIRLAFGLFWCVLVGFSAVALGADWPQWRGASRDAISPETGLLKAWPKAGPPLLWTFREAGVGYSGPAIVGGHVYMMGARGDSGYVYAIDAQTAKELWSAKIGPVFDPKQISQWGGGPRATPTVDGDLVFALGGQGELVCVASADGSERWRLNIFKDLHGEISPRGGNDWQIGWGYTSSPLVDAEQVVCVPGGKDGMLAALDKRTGKVLWRSKDLAEPATYSSPIVADVTGTKQYIILSDRGAAGVSPKDGTLLWQYERKPAYSENSLIIPTPIFHDNLLYFAVSGGCDLLRLTTQNGKTQAAKVFSNRNLVNRLGGTVLINKHVYGYADGKGWVCQDLQTGKIVWSEKRKLGPGSIAYADGHLYCYGEDEGVTARVKTTPDGWKEDGRFELPQKSKLSKPDGRIWTHPVIADGRLYLRDQELLFCYDVRDHSADGK